MTVEERLLAKMQKDLQAEIDADIFAALNSSLGRIAVEEDVQNPAFDAGLKELLGTTKA